ncbi:hypothetical protein IE81DRAFT_363362 [Ceraceosorus guamensis]|uniref:Uncharacterized protein n=1 Tax=Ceraceosorus guamensis TaxID=1522189 RepID=A0A316WFH0_9BASI|nr:hypothetical protein IE81DRAFT_363362 [Ceraceosorus guamensis]PWN46383.1 hypothetical protein IE81DRAFT_363362 [Ceraceosorus guamensis]
MSHQGSVKGAAVLVVLWSLLFYVSGLNTPTGVRDAAQVAAKPSSHKWPKDLPFVTVKPADEVGHLPTRQYWTVKDSILHYVAQNPDYFHKAYAHPEKPLDAEFLQPMTKHEGEPVPRTEVRFSHDGEPFLHPETRSQVHTVPLAYSVKMREGDMTYYKGNIRPRGPYPLPLVEGSNRWLQRQRDALSSTPPDAARHGTPGSSSSSSRPTLNAHAPPYVPLKHQLDRPEWMEPSPPSPPPERRALGSPLFVAAGKTGTLVSRGEQIDHTLDATSTERLRIPSGLMGATSAPTWSSSTTFTKRASGEDVHHPRLEASSDTVHRAAEDAMSDGQPLYPQWSKYGTYKMPLVTMKDKPGALRHYKEGPQDRPVTIVTAKKWHKWYVDNNVPVPESLRFVPSAPSYSTMQQQRLVQRYKRAFGSLPSNNAALRRVAHAIRVDTTTGGTGAGQYKQRVKDRSELREPDISSSPAKKRRIVVQQDLNLPPDPELDVSRPSSMRDGAVHKLPNLRTMSHISHLLRLPHVRRSFQSSSKSPRNILRERRNSRFDSANPRKGANLVKRAPPTPVQLNTDRFRSGLGSTEKAVVYHAIQHHRTKLPEMHHFEMISHVMRTVHEPKWHFYGKVGDARREPVLNSQTGKDTHQVFLAPGWTFNVGMRKNGRKALVDHEWDRGVEDVQRSVGLPMEVDKQVATSRAQARFRAKAKIKQMRLDGKDDGVEGHLGHAELDRPRGRPFKYSHELRQPRRPARGKRLPYKRPPIPRRPWLVGESSGGSQPLGEPQLVSSLGLSDSGSYQGPLLRQREESSKSEQPLKDAQRQP